jgi:protein-S-isoprenylcysteine O-methyltransferase Ste14
MPIRPSIIFAVIWLGWLVSWIVAGFWTNRTEKRAATWDVWVYRALIVAGAALLFDTTRRVLHEPRLWHVGFTGAYVLAGVTLAGILFTWWARLHIGRLWSGSITRKADHYIVDTGPYALVRHPIYTGLILAIIATATAQATVTSIVAAVLITAGFWLKAHIEERFLTSELGAEAYGSYRSRVPMLIPLGRARAR